MKRHLALLVGTLATALFAGATEDPGVHSRTWWLNLQAPTETALVGTFEKVENGFVIIRTPSGEHKRIVAGNLGWACLAYVQRQQTHFPTHIRRIAEPNGPSPLIDLRADRLPLGKIDKWDNRGSIGGAFHVANEKLPVVMMAGRKAVEYYYGPWNLPLEFPTMIADFYAPKSLAANGPFTVSAWLYNPSALGGDITRETVLSWHGIGGDDGTDIGYGEEGRYPHEKSQIGGAFCGAYGGFGFPDATFPELNRWHYIVYVFDGKRDGDLCLYVDGALAAKWPFRRSILLRPAANIGTDSATVRADLYLRDRKPVDVMLVLGDNDNHFARGPKDWTVVRDLGDKGPGTVEETVHGLKPGTRYYYRFVVSAPNETRWSDGAGSFVTAGAENPGRNVPKDPDKLMFLGSSFGCQWDWVTRPRYIYTGGIASLRVYNRALTGAEVRRLCSEEGAKPAPPQIARIAPRTVPAPSYFTPEFDGLVSEPMPETILQSGVYTKLMEAVGQIVISGPKCPDEAMRLCSYTMSKMLAKRPDIVESMTAQNCGAVLDYEGMPQGWNELITQCYGNVRTFECDPTFYWGLNIMYHEMGHAFHMFGAEMTEANFRQRLFNVFWRNKLDQKWIGDYAGFNLWEYIACVGSSYGSDGDPEDTIIRRETVRRTDPRMFYLLEDYWPGDKLVELLPGTGVATDGTGTVTSWNNLGGLEYWGRFGLAKHERSVGCFQGSGKPKLTTVQGASAVKLSGSDVLDWTCRTRECLIDNHAWSIEGWFLRDPRAWGDETLVRWGTGRDFVRLGWGSCDFGSHGKAVCVRRPSSGCWHHIVATYSGGGIANGKGTVRIFVDGELAAAAKVKLNIPTGQSIAIGARSGGFRGAIGQLRIYDYRLGDLQLRKLYSEQKAAFEREAERVAGSLAVDLDAKALAPCPVYQARPLYPQAVGRPWVRSWANYGTLGGKLQNDASASSEPLPGVVSGAEAVSFRGKDRMASSFEPDKRLLATVPVTLEAWVYRAAEDEDSSVVAQWGCLSLAGRGLPKGRWCHVALIAGGRDGALYVDGKRRALPAGERAPNAGDRLNLGASHASGAWTDYFRGALAQLRVHVGALTSADIRADVANSGLHLASLPQPATGDRVVASRRPALSWTPGVDDGDAPYDVYLGTSASEIAKADAHSRCYMGRFRPGEFKPTLEPGTSYYWRVDPAGGRRRFVGAEWHFDTCAGAVVDLDASHLTAGPVSSWENLGVAKGRFGSRSWSAVAAPTVHMQDGRKGVDFAGGKCLALVTPQGKISTSNGFTLTAWAYSIQVPDQAAVASWDGSVFGNGRNAKSGAYKSESDAVPFAGPFTKVDDQHTNAPLVNYWNHLAYVYSRKTGKLSIYVDGRLNVEKAVKMPAVLDSRFAIGAALEGDGTWDTSYLGLIDDVRVYPAALSAGEVQDVMGDKPVRSGAMVRLEAARLPFGKLSLWPNEGSLGGAMRLPPVKPQAPQAEVVDGRKAVTFSGGASCLVSDVVTPMAVTRMRPVTIEVWAYNPSVEPAETLFSLAPRKAFAPSYGEDFMRRALELRYGRDVVFTGTDNRTLAWDQGKVPAAKQWHHIAFVYDGALHGWGRVYVDGALYKEKGWYTLSTLPGLPMVVGSAWNTDYGPIEGFTGSLASVKVYDYAKTADEVRAAYDASHM